MTFWGKAMDDITRTMHEHYTDTFALHGATARGVDWGAEDEVIVRYDKMLAVLKKDFAVLPSTPSLLDVGCGWGGLLRRARALNIPLEYTGTDIVEEMIVHGRNTYPGAQFIHGDVFDFAGEADYDFVVCNGILTLKLAATIPEMESHARRLIRKLFEQCRHGIAFNMMSTRVNFMANNLYYQNPAELMTWLLTEISPRVRLDHGYTSLGSGNGRLYEFTAYVYKD
jgi:2-polyprenyl-3-methyl-5-hydroxy-6-metoxy-1,4-benzoquinol methylase